MLSILPDLYNFDNCIGRPPFLALCKRCETSRRAGHTAMHATCLPCLGRRKDVGANQSRAISGSGAFPVAESVEAPGAIPMAKPFKWTYQENPVFAEMPGCFGPRVLIFKKQKADSLDKTSQASQNMKRGCTGLCRRQRSVRQCASKTKQRPPKKSGSFCVN